MYIAFHPVIRHTVEPLRAGYRNLAKGGGEFRVWTKRGGGGGGEFRVWTKRGGGEGSMVSCEVLHSRGEK